MKQQFWDMYNDFIKYKHYFQLYNKKSTIIDRMLSIGIALISSASVASWLIWQNWTIIWAVIIGVSNILSIIKPYLPYEKRLSSIRYLLPSLRNLINDAGYYYNSIDLKQPNITEEEINDHIKRYKQTYIELENKFIDNSIFPYNEKINSKAEKNTKNELERNSSSNIGVDKQ